MDNNSKYFITLLSSFINQKEPVQKLEIDWCEVQKLAMIHSVGGIIYSMANKLEEIYKPKLDILQKMTQDYALTILRSSIQEYEMENLINSLDNAKIPHVLIKGFIIRDYYPAKEMRTMGDIDILIKYEDREKTDKLMLNMGYIAGHKEEEVWDYTKNSVHIEVHTQIMYHNLTNNVDYVSYFSEAWNHVIQKSNVYTYELNDEYHLLFILIHTAKHLNGSGCGIRMIMDIAMYLIYFKDSLDWNYLNREIEKLNLVLFTKNILILCKMWFEVKFPYELPKLDDDFYRDLSDYILSAGTYGYFQRNPNTKILRNEFLKSKVEVNGFRKTLAMINLYRKIFFPNYKDMSKIKYYSFIKNRPWLIPFGWIYRVFRCIFLKSEKSLGLLGDISNEQEESEKQYKIIRRLGL